MRAALEALGIGVRDAGPSALEVSGGRNKLRAPARPLFIGNSGTAVRFLAALAALVPGDVTLEGDAAMARRPIQDLVDGLASSASSSIARRAVRRSPCGAGGFRVAA